MGARRPGSGAGLGLCGLPATRAHNRAVPGLNTCIALASSLRRASLVQEHRESSYGVRRALFSLLLLRPAPSHGSCRPRALPLPFV